MIMYCTRMGQLRKIHEEWSPLQQRKTYYTFLTNLTRLKRKRIVSILLMIAISAVFLSSGVFTNIATAQTSKTASDSKNYKDFQNCLSSAAAAKGYATKQEIKGCYNPIYNPTANSSASTASSTVAPSSLRPPPLSPTP
jgi:hypothetical protein